MHPFGKLLVLLLAAVLALALGLALALALVAGGCGDGSTGGTATPDRRVMVSVPPLVELVRPLVASDVAVESVLPAGVSAHGYEPDPAKVARMARSGVILLVGLGLEENWGAGAARRPLGTVIRVEDFIDPEDCGDPTHNHGHDHASNSDDGHHGHHHGPIDPHIWLDPPLVRKWLPQLVEALPEAFRGDPESLASKLASLDEIDAEYRERLEPFNGAVIVTHHNAFGRLAQRYGLRVAEVIRPVSSAEPSPAQLAASRRAIESEKASAIFVEPQFDQSLARRLAEETDLPVGVLDPLGDDWDAMMRSNLDVLTEILRPRDDASADQP